VSDALPGRVRALFDAALEQPEHARLEFVRSACGGDETLFREVAELLAFHATEAEARAPSRMTDPDGDLIGSVVGSYRIVRLLGKGGMGEVYLACRADGAFQRDVALKVVGARAASDELNARFEEECRILASLRHPYIANLFDAGRMDDGRLYFVMEYVDGLPITTYCDRQAMSIARRIALFGEVCDAVSFAHRNLIVHRDLKPANVLIDADGHPKLLDFGIAKALTRAGLEASDPTDLLHKRVTPAYASPEQLRGEATHTGMDVFALGVILHELITRHRPRLADAETTTTDGGEYRKPSVVIRERGETHDPIHRLPRDLTDDLDAIVLHTLSTNPQARYASVESLSADLRAALRHEPVSVRPASIAYRSRQFLRRNRSIAAMTAVAVLGLVAALFSVVQLWNGARRERASATARFEQSRALAASLFAVDQTLAGVPGATTARVALTQSISRYLAGVRGTAADDRGLLLDVAKSYRRVGDVQGNPNGPNLGDRQGALASYRAARDILEGLDARGHAPPQVAVALVETLASEGDIDHVLGQREDASRVYQDALNLVKVLADNDRSDPRYAELTARIHRAIGDVTMAGTDWDAAASSYREALSIELGLARRVGESDERRRLLALTRLRVASASEKQGAWRDAREQYASAVETLRAMTAAGGGRAGLMRDTAVGLTRLAVVTQAEDAPAALQQLEDAIRLLEQLFDADAADTRVRIDLYRAWLQHGDALRATDFDRAQRSYRKARSIAEGLQLSRLATPDIQHDLDAIDLRLAAGPTPIKPELQLFAIDHGKRVAIGAKEPFPASATSVAAAARLPAGLIGYVLMFGAQGGATVFDQVELDRAKWTLPLTGPPPAQTILLLTLPRRLSADERRRLVEEISAVPGPRAVDFDSQVIWSSDAEETILSTASSRGAPNTSWIKAIRSRLATLEGARFAGRTFPIALRPQS